MSTSTADTKKIADLRNQLHAVQAEIHKIELKAALLGHDYTGPTCYMLATRGVFGREIIPARTVKADGPSLGDMIAYRWEVLRWLMREINIHRGLYDSH